MDNQDLISFASPNPALKKDGQFRSDLESISFDNNNDRTLEKFKAVQNLFSTNQMSEAPPPPPPRNVQPIVSPNGLVSYPNRTLPNLNQLNMYPGQAYQQNFNRMPSFQVNNFPNQNPSAQSMYQTAPPGSSRPPSNSLSIQQQGQVQRTQSLTYPSVISKSNSWSDDFLTSTPKHQSPSLRHTSPPPSVVSAGASSNRSSSRKKLSYKGSKKTDPDSLIDLGPREEDAANTTTVSILQDFDPLNECEDEEEEIYWSSQRSNFSESFYDSNDPFSYMEQQVTIIESFKDWKV